MRTIEPAAVPALGVDPLAYEVRRLSELLMRNAQGEAETQHPAPGELATRIADTFSLRGIDVDIALVALGAELDREFRALVDSMATRTELGILGALVPRLEDRLALSDAIGPESPGVRRRLLRRIESDGDGVLVPTRRFKALVSGEHPLGALPEYAERITSAPRDVPWVVAPQGALAAMMLSSDGVMCVVSGPSGVGKTTWACNAAHSLGGTVLRIDAARAARSGAGAAAIVRELMEDAALVRWPVVLDGAGELLRAETRLSSLIEDLLDSSAVKLFVVVSEVSDLSDRLTQRSLAHVHVDAPPAMFRRTLWSTARADDATRNTLAEDLVLTPRQIANAIKLIDAGADPAVAAFEQLSKVQNLTLPDRGTATLDALVLPRDVRAEVVELIQAIRARGVVARKLSSSRGRSITALFDGDSGTGKTFACEVIAAEVGLPLMRVNVASLVDKYIGETEKNLARVFAQAQAQGGILFFDEADALFGNRTDVSRAQDRYANLETNLLLQLMEQFSGVVLLTTNLKRNIDQAFMRRIMFKVYFETPEPPERERLWRSVIPPEEFEPDIDFVRLANAFGLSGGSIRAAALRAAYRAAARGGKVSMADLVECAQLETQGMGRVATW